MSNRVDGAALGMPGRKFFLQPADGITAAFLLVEERVSVGRLFDAIEAVTGYPAASLHGAQLWESDLGIDRVKRQKILALLGIPEGALLEARQLGDWNTALGETVSSVAPPVIFPAPAPLVLPTTEAELADLILGIAAEKTGYTREQLALDADLEAELGIDTIKQAQIAGALRRYGSIRLESGLRIRDFPTLRHWLKFLLTQAGMSDSPVVAEAVPCPETELERLVLVSREVALLPDSSVSFVGLRFVLTRDSPDGVEGGRVAAELVRLLELQGAHCLLVADAAACVGPFDGVVHLAPLAPAGATSVRTVEDQRIVHACLTLAKAGTPRFFFVATRLPLRSASAGARGFVKALARERPACNARWLGLTDPLLSKPRAAAATIFEELVDSMRDVEIFRSPTSRGTLDVTSLPLDLSAAPRYLPAPGSLVLISGGATGIGREIALDFTRTFGCRVALLGRSAAAGLSDFPEGLAHYFSCDVADERAMREAQRKIRATLGRISGVVHAAGVIEDRTIEKKDLESFDRVWRTKVEGMRNLARWAREDQPAFVIGFSSVSGRFGNEGQCDYSAANDALTTLLEGLGRELSRARCFAISWGAWDEVGMAARTGVAALLNEAGLGTIARTEGVEAFRSELLFGGTHSEVVVRRAPVAPSREPPPELPSSFSLLGTALRFTPGSALISRRDLDPARDRWLRDHQLLGAPILPATFGIEMMSQAALALLARGGFRFAGLRALKIHEKIEAVDGALTPVWIDARALATGSASEREVRVRLESGARGRLCLEAHVLLTRQPSAPRSATLNIPRTDGVGILAAAAVYERLPLGPSFHVLDEFRTCAADGVWYGRVHGAALAGQFHTLGISFEAAFHTVALGRLLGADQVLIPKSVAEIRAYHHPGDERGLWVRASQQADGLFDIDILHPEQGLCAEIRGFATHDISALTGGPFL